MWSLYYYYYYYVENGFTAAGFSLLDEEHFDDIGLTKFGKILILKTLAEIKVAPSK
jgi:hypothetical protein